MKTIYPNRIPRGPHLMTIIMGFDKLVKLVTITQSNQQNTYLGNVVAEKNFDDSGAVEGFRIVSVLEGIVLWGMGRNWEAGLLLSNRSILVDDGFGASSSGGNGGGRLPPPPPPGIGAIGDLTNVEMLHCMESCDLNVLDSFKLLLLRGDRIDLLLFGLVVFVCLGVVFVVKWYCWWYLDLPRRGNDFCSDIGERSEDVLDCAPW